MPERNELITVCRHIGGMMEAGVDILRITRVLRAQTETPRLLQLYDALDRDMTMGRSLAEAMSRAPDVFSPFVVQMIQQGEARNDLAGAFLKVADFLKQEQELDEDAPVRESVRESSTREASGRRTDDNVGADARDETSLSKSAAPDLLPRTSATSPLTVIALDGLMDRLQTFMLRALTITSGLMLSLASVWWLLELGYFEKRWSMPLAFSVTAVFLGGAGTWIQRRIRSERRREARCSFCGRQGIDLQRAPRFAGAAICSRCAAIVAKKSDEKTETEAQQSSPNSPVASSATPHNSVENAVSDSANEASTPDEISQDESPSSASPGTSSTRSNDVVFKTNERSRAASENVFDERNDVVSPSSSRDISSKTSASRETATRKTARVVSGVGAVSGVGSASSRKAAPADEEDFE